MREYASVVLEQKRLQPHKVRVPSCLFGMGGHRAKNRETHDYRRSAVSRATACVDLVRCMQTSLEVSTVTFVRACQSTVTDVTCRLPRSALCPFGLRTPCRRARQTDALPRIAQGRRPRFRLRKKTCTVRMPPHAQLTHCSDQNVYHEDATSSLRLSGRGKGTG